MSHRYVSDVSSNPCEQRPSGATQLADCRMYQREETLNRARWESNTGPLAPKASDRTTARK